MSLIKIKKSVREDFLFFFRFEMQASLKEVIHTGKLLQCQILLVCYDGAVAF